MGFWENLDRSIDQFIQFRPDVYRAEIFDLEELELQALHKRIQRKIVGGGTQIVLGVAAVAATGGLSLIGSGIGGRRIGVNKQRCEVITALMGERGWAEHNFTLKDLAAGAAPGALAAALAPGADHVVSHVANHIATATAHHGADHVANYAATATVQPGAHSAGTALGISAADRSSHAAIKMGTNYVLNGRPDRAAFRKKLDSQKILSSQKEPTPQTAINYSATKPSTCGSAAQKEAPGAIHTTGSATDVGGFTLTATAVRIALILLPAIIGSVLGQGPSWLAIAINVLMAYSAQDVTFVFFLIVSLIVYFFAGLPFLWFVSVAAALGDVLFRHGEDWHERLRATVMALIYVAMGIFVLVIGASIIMLVLMWIFDATLN